MTNFGFPQILKIACRAGQVPGPSTNRKTILKFWIFKQNSKMILLFQSFFFGFPQIPKIGCQAGQVPGPNTNKNHFEILKFWAKILLIFWNILDFPKFHKLGVRPIRCLGPAPKAKIFSNFGVPQIPKLGCVVENFEVLKFWTKFQDVFALLVNKFCFAKFQINFDCCLNTFWNSKLLMCSCFF